MYYLCFEVVSITLARRNKKIGIVFFSLFMLFFLSISIRIYQQTMHSHETMHNSLFSKKKILSTKMLKILRGKLYNNKKKNLRQQKVRDMSRE